MAVLPPAAPPRLERRGLLFLTWIVQSVVALVLAFGASFLASRAVAVLLIAAAAGVLAASAVALVLWVDHRSPPDRPV